MKVWSTGCSFTEGLNVPSEKTYARLLNVNSDINDWSYQKYEFGQSGHGNQYIFRTAIEIIEKMDKVNDILIVQWSSPFRQELVSIEGYAFNAPFEFVSLGFKYGLRHPNFFNHNSKDASIDDEFTIAHEKYNDFIKKYSKKFMNPKYMELLSFNMQVSLFHLLKSMGIKSLQFYGWEGCKLKEKNIYNFIPENENFLKETFESFCADKGEILNNEHPSIEMHSLFSEFLLNKLKSFNYI